MQGFDKISENEDLCINVLCGVLVGNHMYVVRSERKPKDKPGAIEDSI
jgi:hypothetical protein